MSKVWNIYSKNTPVSGTPKYVAENLEYHDTWMGEEYVMVTIVTDKSPNPNDPDPFSLEIGDFIEYRGRRYFIYNIPSALKQARKHTYGEAFKYENVKFSSVGMELSEIRFLDIVLGDNQLHYTSLPTFQTYCETVEDLVDRLQANTDREHNGNDSWYFITPNKQRTLDRCIKWNGSAWVRDTERRAVAETLWNEAFSNGSYLENEKKNVSINVDKVSVWDGLGMIKNHFGLNFVLSPTTLGRVVVIGAMASDTGHDFMYGKGNGLHQIERVADSDQLVVTKLFAYGSDTNLPYHYYAELGRKPYFVVSEKKTETIIVSHPRYILCSTLSFAAIEPYLNGVDNKVTLYVGNQYCTAWCETDGTENNYTRFRLIASLDSNIDFLLFDASKENGRVYISSGVNVNSWPNVEQDEDGLPNNMAVNCLMLPGFPKYALNDVVKCEYVYIENEQIVDQTRFFIRRTPTDTYSTTPSFVVNGNHVLTFSTDKLRPWIKSPNVAEIGVKEGDIHFTEENDDNGLQDIHPSIEGMTEDDVFHNGSSVRLDEIVAVDTITDDGYFADGVSDIPKFTITIRDLGFDLRQAYADAGSSMKLSMKDGYCGGRDFDVKGVTQLSNGQWKLTIKRCPDDALELYFPYSDSVAHGGVATQNEPYQIRGSHMEGDVMVSGDHFVLTDILIYDTNYVYAASVEMFKKSVLWIIGNDYTRFTYLPKIDEIFMAKNQDTANSSQYYELKAGKLMHFEDEDLGIDARIYIDQLTIREGDGVPKYEVTLRENKQVSSIQRMVDKAVSENATIAGGGNTNYSNRQIQSLIEKYGDEHYLSKTDEDEAAEKIGFLKGLWIKAKGLFGFDADGNVKANDVSAEGDASVGGDLSVKGIVRALRGYLTSLQSPNYSGDGVTDKGFLLTSEYNGHSRLTIDEIYVRMKAVFESLEVKERTYSGGDQIWSCAGNQILRTDYLGNEVNDQGQTVMISVHEDGSPASSGTGAVYSVPAPGKTYGYSKTGVPFLLKKIPLLLGFSVFSKYNRARIVLERDDSENMHSSSGNDEQDTLSVIRRARCYFLAYDGEREIKNWWRINDLARCQTMNLGNNTRQTYISGEDTKHGNIFWWRKVIGVSYEPVTLDDGRQYHYFDVAFDYDREKASPASMATSVMEGSDIPAAGDAVVQFGNTVIEGRMNLMMMEVNGSDAVGYNPSTDAPCLKAYRGIYCFDLGKSWVGGNPCKMKLSPKSGYEFYGPNFKIQTEYDSVPVPMDRGEWSNIAKERDDFEPHNNVIKCYYYNRVSHDGSLWLCSIVDGTHWTDGNGNYISDAEYAALSEEAKALCSRKLNYTTDEPSDNSADWMKQVAKGEDGKPGTGVELKGSVDVLYNSQIVGSQTSLEGLTDVGVGECYVVDANRHLYFYNGKEVAFPQDWNDLGVFKGEPGVSSYVHIAYADEVTLVNGVPTAVKTDGVSGKFLKVYDGRQHDWIGLCTNQSDTAPDDFTAYEWNYQRGTAGDNGGNTANVMLYKRSDLEIDTVGIAVKLYYKFADRKLYTKSGNTYSAATSSDLNGWSQLIPRDSTEPIYTTAAIAFSDTAYDDIDTNEWVDVAQMTENGESGEHGINTATVFIYKRNSSVPSDKPTGVLRYTFATGEAVLQSGTMNGWSTAIPSGTMPCYVRQAAAIGTGEYDDIAVKDWSDVRKLVENGAAGNDAWTVIASPSPIIINQDIDNPTSFGLPIEIAFTAKCGDNQATVGTVSATNSMGLSITDGTGKITITAYSKVSDVYVTRGTITCIVPLTYGTRSISLTVSIEAAVNLLGTWSESVKADVKHEVATAKFYFEDENGNVVAYETIGDYIKSSTENISTLTQKVDDGKNMLVVTSGWEDYGGNTSPISYTSDFGILDDDTDLYSPIVNLRTNTTYCFSAWFDGNPQTETGYALAPASGSYAHNSDVYDQGDAYTPSWQTAADERKYFTFTTGNVEQKFVFNQYFSGNNNVYCPQLEIGSVPTPFEASTMEVSSKVKQTATEIDMSITDRLGRVGITIDGASKGIDMQADTFKLRNTDNEQVMGVDSEGNLEMTGTVRAKNFFHNICIITGFYNDISSSKNVNWTTQWYYCKSDEDDRTKEGGYVIGKYYEDNAQRGLLSNSDFVRCSYTADTVIIKDNATAIWPSGVTIHIPRAQDFQGKTIEVRHDLTSGNNSVIIKQTDGIACFADFIYDGQGHESLINPQQTTQSTPALESIVTAKSVVTFYSYQYNGSWYWRRIGLVVTQ